MLSICILILVFISGVSMETCPEPENIYPCRCIQVDRYDIRVTCNSGSKTMMTLTQLETALKGLLGKNDVQLMLYNIQDTLPSNFFSGIGITNLEFYSCSMDTLTNDDNPGLLGLENHLGVLDISKSDLSRMKLHLGHLKELRIINFFGNDIPELEDDWLTGVTLPSLKHLYIQHNNITKIGSHAFSRLNNLVTLALEDNRFGPVKRSMFSDNIAFLHLENNALADLPVDLFSRMPRIQFIYLNKNRIMTLDEVTWSPIWQQLKELWLKENNIVCDDRLNWITKSNRRPEVIGECSAPKELEKTTLEDFFRSKRR